MQYAVRATLISLALSTLGACTTTGLPIYEKRPLDTWHVTIADYQSQQKLTGTSAVVPKPNGPGSPGGDVAVRESAGALTLRWKDTWYAALRVEGGTPLDLRPYIPNGVLALDVNVTELSKGGIGFQIKCGDDCERQVPYVVPARAMAGKGWQKVVFAMSCFVREGDDFSAVPRPFAVDANGSGEVAIANVRILKSGTPNASCPDYKTVSVTPDMLNESWSIDWWLPRHLAKLEEKKQLKNPELVFIGDSITQGWEKEGAAIWERNYKQYKALALGFGGDRTENVLWRLQHGEVDGIAPKVAVLMFGTNNTGHRREDPRLTAAGIKRNIDELRKRLPNTKILLLAIFPRDEKAGTQMRKINEGINNIIATYADNKTVYFLDINKAFLTSDGTLSKEIMPDFLHPNERGYAIWAQSMGPELQKLMQ